MGKTLEFDLSDDRLIGLASDLVDGHNYISALKMLNKNQVLYGNDEDSLALYAEIFDDIGLFEKCVNGWFRYMDIAVGEDMAECYEGLAVSFMNLGNEHFSAYYYNKLLMETDDIDAESREEILKDFLSAEENPLKFVYPPALADCSGIFSDGIEKMKEGNFDAAVEAFENIAEGNEKYLNARNYIAMCKIIADKREEAEQECLNVLKKNPDNVQALTTLAAVKTESEKYDEAVELAKRLLSLDITQSEDLYKIATVCCENKMHKEAYETFCKLPSEYDYDLNVMYFKAVSAFNYGNLEDSFNIFDNLVTVYPEAVTAKYYYKLARGLAERGEKTELSYFYRLPNDLRESSLKVLTAYMRLSKTNAKKLADEVDLGSCIKWCFDECEGKGGGDLQLLAAQVAIKAEADEIVRDILLNAFLDDRIKIDMLTTLAERNKFDIFGVVICNVYRRVSTQPMIVGSKKKKLFIRAYARLAAHFSILDDEYGQKFSSAAETLYDKLADGDRLDEVKDIEVLTAAVYELSGVRAADIDGDAVYDFFDVDKYKVYDLLR